MVLMLLFAVLLAVQQCQGVEEPFIGWKGESYNPSSTGTNTYGKHQVPRAMLRGPGVPSNDSSIYGQKILSREPRVFYYPHFLTDEECDHLIESAIPTLKKSVIYDRNGKLIVNKMRTSYGTFLRRLQDPIIRNITSRAAQVTRVPVSYQEDLQVLRYSQNQEYQAHVDSHKQGGKDARESTFVLYLSDVEEGGETAFVKTSVTDPNFEAEHGPFSDCAKGHIATKPRKGDAVLFYSSKEDGTLDMNTKHAGCPVIKGTKWTATIWTHIEPFRMKYFHEPTKEEEASDPGYCEDFYPKCREWAKDEQCKKNPVYMVGDGGERYGACRLSCGVCSVCSEGDKECYTANRNQANYLTLPETFKTAKWNSHS